MTTPTHVTLDRVSKWYGDVLGVNEVTMTFRPGVAGLLGPNGAGKSTLMKLLCGMLSPSIGTVRIHGRDPVSYPAVMREVGICPEQDPAYPGVPAIEVLTYLTRLQGFDRGLAATMAAESLERVGLDHAASRPVTGYSKGMRQRFKLAQALAHDPSVVILDEPMNGLDPPSRREFADLIRDLGQAGRCVIVSSHILHEVDSVAERIVVMEHGRVLADGTSRELRAELAHVPLTVRVRTPDAQALSEQVVQLEGLRSLVRTAEGLEVHTHAPHELFDLLGRLAADENAPRITEVTPTDEDLEAVFEYLTR